jgi:hypothetical protein
VLMPRLPLPNVPIGVFFAMVAPYPPAPVAHPVSAPGLLGPHPGGRPRGSEV